MTLPMKREEISLIVEHFRNRRDLVERERQKRISRNNHLENKDFYVINMILTIMLLLFTFTNLFFLIANSTTQNTLNVIKSSNLSSNTVNSNVQNLNYGSAIFGLSTMKYLTYFFPIFILLLLVYLGVSIRFSKKRNDELDSFTRDIIDLETVILMLDVIKIKICNKIRDKEDIEKIYSFDTPNTKDYESTLNVILNKYLYNRK